MDSQKFMQTHRSLHVAYAALLLLPHESAVRFRLQTALATLRDELAEATGKSPQEVQEDYEYAASFGARNL